MKRLSLVAALLLAAAAHAPSDAAAQSAYAYHAPYHLYVGESIPYFAAHPPVYYSYPVPRPYGWSPYAYPPGTLTPELALPELVEPMTIRNPYAPGDDESTTPEEHTAQAAPLRIFNPFVDGNASASNEVAASSRRGPQVIFPAAFSNAE